LVCGSVISTRFTLDGKAVVIVDKDRIAGQKRKQIKQVYRAKLPDTVPSSSVGAGALVLVGEHLIPEDTLELPVTAEGGATDDSNKKQRTNNTRSADPAAAAVQPRHPQ
jgi:hypothetical protein